MEMNCESVWKKVSDYLEGELEPGERAALEQHIAGCPRCTAVWEGVKNVSRLYGDKRAFEVPQGFSQRLHARLDNEILGPRGSSRPWILSLAFAAAFALVMVVFQARDARAPRLLDRMSQSSLRLPPSPVAIPLSGKVFHRPGCPYLRGVFRLVSAEEGIREGYTPCLRCLREYLQTAPQEDVPPRPSSTHLP